MRVEATRFACGDPNVKSHILISILDVTPAPDTPNILQRVVTTLRSAAGYHGIKFSINAPYEAGNSLWLRFDEGVGQFEEDPIEALRKAGLLDA